MYFLAASIGDFSDCNLCRRKHHTICWKLM